MMGIPFLAASTGIKTNILGFVLIPELFAASRFRSRFSAVRSKPALSMMPVQICRLLLF
jgi:hypothetical protein